MVIRLHFANSIESLRKFENKVAICVLADPSSVITSSITELAERSGTSEPTVIRFCRKIGLSGYMELRLNLARDLSTAKCIFENISTKDSLNGIAGKVINAYSEGINNILNKLNFEDLERAVQLLQSARRIEFYGFGGSAIVAKDAYHKFFHHGISTHSQEAAILLAPMTSHLVQLAIIYILFVAVAMNNFSGIKDCLDTIKRSLVEKRH